MKWKSCKKPNIIKNKFISTVIGSLGIYFGLGFILPISYLSVYITSYIHIEQDFVNMHYGYFLNLILTFAMTFSVSLGGMLESKLGFTPTTLLGTSIVLVGNIFFFKIQNIWLCYFLTLIMGLGAGISSSLLGKNLTLYFPKKKGIITSVFGLLLIIIAGLFLVVGEKIISFTGETLQENQEVYSPETAKRTYLYFMLGFFSIPIGDIIFLLFAHEYKKENQENNDNSFEGNNYEYNINENEQKDLFDSIENKEPKGKEKENKEDNNLSGGHEDSVAFRNKKIKKIIKTFRFWRIALASFLVSFPISFMMTTGRTFGALIGIEGGALQFLTVIQGVSIIIVGPIFGFISDKKGPLLILRICTIVAIAPGVILLFFIDNAVLYFISFIFIAIGLVTKMVSFSPFLMEVYGIRESVILSGIINGVGKVGEVITAVSAFVIPFFYSGNEIKTPYKIIFITGSICSGLSLVLFLFESKKKYEYEMDNVIIDKLIENDTMTEAEMDKKI